MEEITLTEEGVRKLLLKLNPHKASAPDLNPARILKDMADEISPLLTIIFQRSFDCGKVPDDWRSANTTPVFKKGDRLKASNYHPVSQMDLIILDFSKAFDRVPHQRLLAKIDHYGIRGQTYRWIQSFLSERSQPVIVDGSVSDKAPVVSGVPQGTVLGPLLFLLFISDLLNCVKAKTRLFANDCIIYQDKRCSNDCLQLQDDLNRLAYREEKWGMCFHPENSSVLRVTRSRWPVLHDYSLKGQILQAESHLKYLVVDLTASLTWNTHIDRVVKKGNSMLGFLQRNLQINNQDTKPSAYFTLVCPNLEYCSTVWSPYTSQAKHKIEMVQRRSA